MIALITTITDKLIEIYEDKDNARRDEIAAMGAGGPDNSFPAFYDRPKAVKIFC
ncbi:putative Splicing factor SF3a60 [Cocos nucifera]|nr:putative Splicing factor SF3a60 [Cocos nucifera]